MTNPDTALKVEPPSCDGVHHRWTVSAPVVCKGCGHKFSDTSDLELRAAYLRKYGADLSSITRERM